jgi:hypothetical protein
LLAIGFLRYSGLKRDRANFISKHRAIHSQSKEDTNAGLFHHRVEFKGFTTRRQREERLVEGDFSGRCSDFFFRSAKRREAIQWHLTMK